MYIRVIAAFFFVVIGVFFQFQIGDIYGVWLNFTLAALISLSFVLNFPELLFIILFALFALNWQPGISFELIVFGIVPIGSFLAGKFLPFEPWAGNILLTLIGIMIPYVLFGIHVILKSPVLFVGDSIASLFYSAIIFKAMISFFPSREQDSLS